jgi:membrane-bound ClpP family serine protease
MGAICIILALVLAAFVGFGLPVVLLLAIGVTLLALELWTSA